MTTEQINALRQSNAIDFAHAQANHEEVGRAHEVAIAENQRLDAEEHSVWEEAHDWIRQDHVIDLLHDEALNDDAIFEDERCRVECCPHCGERY